MNDPGTSKQIHTTGSDEGFLPPVTVVQRKRQRTMRIRVKDDTIIVSGPASVSKRRLLQFAEEKRAWIRSACLRRREKVQKLALKREQAQGTLLLRGQRVNVYDFPVPGLRKPILEELEHAIVYRYNPLDHLSGDATPSKNAGVIQNSLFTPHPETGLVHDFYRRLAKKELAEKFHYWSERLPFTPSRLSIRNQRTKWGSCSSRGTISLNWRLVKCPPAIMDYIIIHELCHLRHFNHSRAFWDTVRQYYPAAREAKQWIRNNSDEIFADF
ncbi:MAG: M48 family peptidase [Balneolaceae bacterium]|nr:MAG: M48 family peptidase [Balneolaceae bacterium]